MGKKLCRGDPQRRSPKPSLAPFLYLAHPIRPHASALKNAGLAYLNLVKSKREDGEHQRDILRMPHDPLGATPLLPWVAKTDESCLLQEELLGDCLGNAQGRMLRSVISQETIGLIRDRRKTYRAEGDWRGAASARFMQLWKEFLEHKDAPLDSQYDAVRTIYEHVLGRLRARDG